MGEENHYFYEFGPFRLDAQKRLLLRGGETVKLSPKDFDTLLALVEHSGEVLDKDALMKLLWGDTIVEEGNLATYISHLRRALGERPHEHEYIVTVPGQGYRFVAGVRQSFDEVVVHERTRAELTVEEEETDLQGEAGLTLEGQAQGANGNFTSPGVTAAAAKLGSGTTQLAPAASRIRAGGVKKALMIVALALAVGAITSGSYEFIRRRQAGNRAAAPFGEIKLTRLTNSGKAALAAISPDGRYVVYVMRDAGGQSLWLKQVATSSNVRIAEPRPVEYWGLTVSPDGDYVYTVVWEGNTGEVALYRMPILGGPAAKLPVGSTSPISFSPDGRQFTFMNTLPKGTQLMVANADGTGAREIASRQQPDFFCAIGNGPAWSPDGKVIAVTLNTYDEIGQYQGVLAVNPADGSQRMITSQRFWSVGGMKWLADGSGMLATVYERATSPSQIWHISYPGGEARKITNDLNDYDGISLTADASMFVTVQRSMLSSLWVAPGGDGAAAPAGSDEFTFEAGRARQLVHETGGIWDIAWMPDGRIVYGSRASGDANIWVAAADGSNPKQLTIDAGVDRGLAVSPDGRYIVFSSNRAGAYNIWRVDADGGNLKQLTGGKGDTRPDVSPDGKWVVYQHGYGLVSPTLWKVSIDGGEAIQLSDTRVQRPHVSPDGRLVAYYYLDADVGGYSRWSMGIIPFEGGHRLKRFYFPPMVISRIVRWTHDGRALAYVDTRDGISNVWSLPLDGEPPVQLTDFNSALIAAFEWSRDGKQLALALGSEASDVVLIRNIR